MFNEIVWKEGEKLTANYMKKNGYKILYTNFSCVGVELDIVAILPIASQKMKLKMDLKDKLSNETDPVMRRVLQNIYENNVKKLTDLLVITEVKSRSSNNYGTGAEALNKSKFNNIKRGAEFLIQQKQFQNMQVRFDVSSVDNGVITYIEDAF